MATCLSLIAACYHFIGIFYPLSPVPLIRHLVFFFISLFCAYGFYWRPTFFVIIFSCLVVQQLYSHGGSLIRHWMDYGAIDWIDLAVVIFIPLFFINLILDWRLEF